jgi:anti-anti-sigma factor
MEILVHRQDDHVTHLALSGRLDILGLQQIELPFTAHTSSRRKHAVVDVSQVTYMSSLGIRLILSSAKALSAHGARLVLVNPQPQVLQVLQLGRLDTIIAIESDVPAAFASVGVQ